MDLREEIRKELGALRKTQEEHTEEIEILSQYGRDANRKLIWSRELLVERIEKDIRFLESLKKVLNQNPNVDFELNTQVRQELEQQFPKITFQQIGYSDNYEIAGGWKQLKRSYPDIAMDLVKEYDPEMIRILEGGGGEFLCFRFFLTYGKFKSISPLNCGS
jgi:hypothetical protein